MILTLDRTFSQFHTSSMYYDDALSIVEGRKAGFVVKILVKQKANYAIK